jgi:hypothetical protein
MNTEVHLWQYLAQFFLEWEILQTKVVEKIKTHVLCSITSFRKLCRLWDNVEKYGTARQATDDNIIRPMRFACWITEATNTLRIRNRLLFYGNNCYANAPQCYVIGALPVLLKPVTLSLPATSPQHHRLTATSVFLPPATHATPCPVFWGKQPQRLTQETVALHVEQGFEAYPDLAFILPDETNSQCFTAVVFNLGYAYPREYAKTS